MKLRSRKAYRSLFADRVLKSNLVLVEGVGLCPLIGAATTLENSIVLFLCTAITLVVTNLVMLGIGRKLPTTLRIPLHTLCASILLCGEGYFINEFVSTELYASLYLFLPLLAVTTLFAYHGDNAMGSFDSRAAFVDAFASALGFGGVLCLVGALRELAVNRSLWGYSLPLSFNLPEASRPFAAFLLLGLLAALLQRGKNLAADRAARYEPTTTGGDA